MRLPEGYSLKSATLAREIAAAVPPTSNQSLHIALKSATLAREIAAYGCLLVGSVKPTQAWSRHSPLSQ